MHGHRWGGLYVRKDDIISFVRDSGGKTLTCIRWGGAAAAIAGFSYASAGYLDKPGMSGYASALVSVLSVIVPALLLGGLLGLRQRLLLGGERSFTGGAGFVLGCLGTMLGVIAALGSEQPVLGLTSIGLWWWAPLLAGLTLMGLATLPLKAQRGLGALVLTSGMLGWVSLLTDPAFPGVLVPMRPVHVAFAAAFCLTCVLWGGGLFVGAHRLGRPKP